MGGRSRGALAAALTAIVCILPVPGVAQETGPTPAPDPAEGRAAEWRALREQKARKPPTEYSPGFFERLMLKADKGKLPKLAGWNVAGFYPRAQSIAVGSRTAAGLRFWQPDIAGSRLDLHASAFYSSAGYQYYDVQFGRVPHDGAALPLRATDGTDLYEIGARSGDWSRELTLYGSLQYRRYTELEYFGSGPDSSEDAHSAFLAKGPLAELVAGYQFSPSLALRVRAGLFQPEVGSGEDALLPPVGDLFDDVAAPGLEDQPDFLTAGARLVLDLRDVPGAPHAGAFVSLHYARFDDREDDAFDFHRFSFDARGYVPLGARQRVLALRAYGNFDRASGDARVPFYLQQSLGGTQSLRGFQHFRFRGDELVLFQAEYRWEASPVVELAAFVDAGAVAATGTGVDLDDLETDWGLGLRLKNWRTVFLRFEVARSDEATRFVFNTNAVF